MTNIERRSVKLDMKRFQKEQNIFVLFVINSLLVKACQV